MWLFICFPINLQTNSWDEDWSSLFLIYTFFPVWWFTWCIIMYAVKHGMDAYWSICNTYWSIYNKILQTVWRKIQFKRTKSLKYNSESTVRHWKLRHLSCYVWQCSRTVVLLQKVVNHYFSAIFALTCGTVARLWNWVLLKCCCCKAAVCSIRCCCWAAYICWRYWAAELGGRCKACWITCDESVGN